MKIEADRQRALYEDILLTVSDKHENVLYVPLFQNMCDAKVCSLFDSGGIRYVDGDHISRRTSLGLIPKISEEIFANSW